MRSKSALAIIHSRSAVKVKGPAARFSGIDLFYCQAKSLSIPRLGKPAAGSCGYGYG